MVSRVAGIFLLIVGLLFGAVALKELPQPGIDADDIAFQTRLTIFLCTFGAAALVSGVVLLARRRP